MNEPKNYLQLKLAENLSLQKLFLHFSLRFKILKNSGSFRHFLLIQFRCHLNKLFNGAKIYVRNNIFFNWAFLLLHTTIGEERKEMYHKSN